MSGIQQVLLGGSPAAYQIERSLRFNSADSAYLNRTPGSAGNRKTWTWSCWVKRTTLSSTGTIFSAGTSSGANIYALQTVGDQLAIRFDQEASGNVTTTQVFRDASAWYHFVFAIDTTQATSSNRVKIYVNGSQITAFGTATYPSQNFDTAMNNNVAHQIGLRGYQPDLYLNSYLTEINFVDGQALTPSDFGETDSATGVWKPKKFSGTYGTNGFYLNFSDNSNTTSTTLGKDSSGNGNNWTPSGFSVASGVGNDSLVDTPTSYGTDTGVGGTVRGNYATLNAAAPGITALANGNLQFNYNATYSAQGTIGVTSGKWYFEGVVTTQVIAEQVIGVVNQTWVNSTSVGADVNGWGIIVQSNANNGQAYHNGAVTSSYATFANGDIAMVAFDVDSGKIWFGRNGTWFNSGAPASGTGNIYSNLSGTIFPAFNNKTTSGGVLYANFGQRAFAYTAPSGFKALCTQNLPTPTIGATSTTQAGKYFNAVLYTGDGSTPRSITVGFQTDFVWHKPRTTTGDHQLFDAVRGAGKGLFTNGTFAEYDYGTGSTSPFISFDSNGYTIGTGANGNTVPYVSWNWKANGAGSSNTAGTITSTVSANTTSGFSIVTWSGPNNNTTSTVGHGLGVAPSMVIYKDRADADNWNMWHSSFTGGEVIYLNLTNVKNSDTNVFNNTAPTSTLLTVKNVEVNGSSMVAYCFAAVAGYSAFGSYTGNGSTDGPFVYTGFRPRYVLIKRTDTTENWYIKDTLRPAYNVNDKVLYANHNYAEGTEMNLDILSNGFKARGTDGGFNASGGTYIYAAFAESPFKYSLAR